MSDVFDFSRFVQAQEPVIAQVRDELREGAKRGHWMWFVFPQLAGLGRSATARHYALQSLSEAAAYLEHPVLGPRLVECAALANDVAGRSAFEVFGSPDDLKFRSSMTLFARVQPGAPVFQQALDRYFDGAPDPLTAERLAER